MPAISSPLINQYFTKVIFTLFCTSFQSFSPIKLKSSCVLYKFMLRCRKYLITTEHIVLFCFIAQNTRTHFDDSSVQCCFKGRVFHNCFQRWSGSIIHMQISLLLEQILQNKHDEFWFVGNVIGNGYLELEGLNSIACLTFQIEKMHSA